MIEYNFNKEECWYKEVCNKYNSEECCASCIRYLEMYHLLNKSLLPKNKQRPIPLYPDDIDIDAFNYLKSYKDNIVTHINNGDNLYLYGNVAGNGKTSWSIKIMLKYFNEIWSGNGFKERAYFIHVPTFLNNLKNNISNKDEAFEQLKQNLLKVDLVIWDDIASTSLSNYDYSNLLTYIDQRTLSGLSNIYTGNLNHDELTQAVGERLSSRIYDYSNVVELKGNSRRGLDGIITNNK